VEVAADLHINYALNFLGQDKEYLSELDDTLAKI
jgi:amidohydrolase